MQVPSSPKFAQVTNVSMHVSLFWWNTSSLRNIQSMYASNGSREIERTADFLVEIDIFECAHSVVRCALSALSELISDVRTRPEGRKKKETALFF